MRRYIIISACILMLTIPVFAATFMSATLRDANASEDGVGTLSESQTIIMNVDYTLDNGKDYTIVGTLKDKDTGETIATDSTTVSTRTSYSQETVQDTDSSEYDNSANATIDNGVETVGDTDMTIDGGDSIPESNGNTSGNVQLLFNINSSGFLNKTLVAEVEGVSENNTVFSTSAEMVYPKESKEVSVEIPGTAGSDEYQYITKGDVINDDYYEDEDKIDNDTDNSNVDGDADYEGTDDDSEPDIEDGVDSGDDGNGLDDEDPLSFDGKGDKEDKIDRIALYGDDETDDDEKSSKDKKSSKNKTYGKKSGKNKTYRKNSSKNETYGKASPATGDTSFMILYLIIVGVSVFTILKMKYGRRE